MKHNNTKEMEALGNHDYGAEEYQENYAYPHEQIDESEKIDKQIFENEAIIISLLQEMLSNNKNYFD